MTGAFRCWLAVIAMLALPVSAHAQYPERPIKLILPFPAGSATDGAARYIAQDVGKALGQPMVIENHAGADGIIAAQLAKRAAPDGYTLFVSTNSAHGSNPALYDSLPYDPVADFAPVAGLIRIPITLVVKKDFPADDVAGFVKLARQRSSAKSLSYGSGNTSNRVAAELVKAAAKIDMINVQYRGTPQALNDLLASQIDVMFVDPYSAMGFINAGQVKVLAVLDSVRHPLLPNVPTMSEAGYKDTQVVTWAAAFAPAKTRQDIVDRLSQAFGQSLAKVQTREALRRMAMTPMEMNASELRAFVASELSRWQKLVQLAGIPKK
ncbi:Bug family tripartite tricarboxylate transporter substrate binding protein [Cupriavidus alkaliphilus]|uniref:Bug family tripartite tricarboxylate transporter substrate binding protein n=1 Tax=Cupriavidus alkaliphilus TaxID=942866 RepID=UPI0016148353|nr:tripartite tricarboxylate transporter substrate binding protein [Cupriavidus alkaliphilus]MBB3014103.1 tripartite-type tricarboxylate transporter receptor subunit TctC [Cupriavidus alkaliphilus]